MQPHPSRQPPVRSGWRVGLLVFSMATLVAAGLTILPLLWPEVRHLERQANISAAVPGLSSTCGAPDLSFGGRGHLFPTDNQTVAPFAATNLAPSAGELQPLVPPTNILAAFRGVAGGGLRVFPTNCIARNTGELPVFAALRASPTQPIPREIADLARDITRDCQTDADRAKAIYDWITGHITYDWKVWADIVSGANSYTQPQDPVNVILRGTAVCAGYAWLFDALAASAGLDANFVIGDVRGYRGTSDDTLVSKYQHAWNTVQIDGQWVLLDSTWGAPQTAEPPADSFARRNYYFQTPPNQLIFDHLPETPDLQLLANPVTPAAFHNLPNLKPAFFIDGLRLGNAFSDSIATPAGTPTGVTVAAPEGIFIAATLLSNGLDISAHNIFIRENGIRRDVALGPLPAGQYILRIFAKPAANPGPYDCVVDYAVMVGP